MTLHVTEITPSDVMTSGGEIITITGDGLTNAYVVIGSRTAQVLSQSDTEIVCAVPPNDPGLYDVTVTSYDDPLDTLTLDEAVAYNGTPEELPTITETADLPWNDEGGAYLGQATDSSMTRQARTLTSLTWVGDEMMSGKTLSAHAWMKLPRAAAGTLGQITVDAPLIALTSEYISDTIWSEHIETYNGGHTSYKGSESYPPNSAINPYPGAMYGHKWNGPALPGTVTVEIGDKTPVRSISEVPVTARMTVSRLGGDFMSKGALGIQWLQNVDVVSTSWSAEDTIAQDILSSGSTSYVVTATPPVSSTHYRLVFRATFTMAAGELELRTRNVSMVWDVRRAIQSQARIAVDVLNGRPWDQNTTRISRFVSPLRSALSDDAPWDTPVFTVPDMRLQDKDAWVIVQLDGIVAPSEIDRQAQIVQEFFGSVQTEQKITETTDWSAATRRLTTTMAGSTLQNNDPNRARWSLPSIADGTYQYVVAAKTLPIIPIATQRALKSKVSGLLVSTGSLNGAIGAHGTATLAAVFKRDNDVLGEVTQDVALPNWGPAQTNPGTVPITVDLSSSVVPAGTNKIEMQLRVSYRHLTALNRASVTVEWSSLTSSIDSWTLNAPVRTTLTYGNDQVTPPVTETVVPMAPGFDPTITTSPPMQTSAPELYIYVPNPTGGSWHSGPATNALNPKVPIANESFSVNCHRALPVSSRPSSIAVVVDQMNLREIVGTQTSNAVPAVQGSLRVTRYTGRPGSGSATVIGTTSVNAPMIDGRAGKVEFRSPEFTPGQGEWVAITLKLTASSAAVNVQGVMFNATVSRMAQIVYGDDTTSPEPPPPTWAGISAETHEEDASVRFTLAANGYRMFGLWFEWLVPDGQSGWVRGYEQQSFGSINGVTIAEDFEAPVGIDVRYTLVRWPSGESRPAYPRPGDPSVVVNIPWGPKSSLWLKNPLEPTQVLTDGADDICVISYPDRTFSANAGIFRPIGRSVPTSIFDVRSGWVGELVIVTKTRSADEKMQAMLKTGGPLLYQTVPELDGVSDYIQPGDAQKEVYPEAPGWYRRWTLPIVQVTRPLGDLGSSPNRPTYSQLKAVWTCCSYRHLKSSGGVYLDMIFYMLMPPESCNDRAPGALTGLPWEPIWVVSDWQNDIHNGTVSIPGGGRLVLSAKNYDPLRRETIVAWQYINITPFSRVKANITRKAGEVNPVRIEIREEDMDGNMLRQTFTDWTSDVSSFSDAFQSSFDTDTRVLSLEVGADCGARRVLVLFWTQLVGKSSTTFENGSIQVAMT